MELKPKKALQAERYLKWIDENDIQLGQKVLYQGKRYCITNGIQDRLMMMNLYNRVDHIMLEENMLNKIKVLDDIDMYSGSLGGFNRVLSVLGLEKDMRVGTVFEVCYFNVHALYIVLEMTDNYYQYYSIPMKSKHPTYIIEEVLKEIEVNPYKYSICISNYFFAEKYTNVGKITKVGNTDLEVFVAKIKLLGIL